VGRGAIDMLLELDVALSM